MNTKLSFPARVFVGGISSTTTESELHQLFSAFGNVKQTKIIQDRAGVSKGYGFVTFETEEEARRLQVRIISEVSQPATSCLSGSGRQHHAEREKTQHRPSYKETGIVSGDWRGDLSCSASHTNNTSMECSRYKPSKVSD